MNRVLVQELKAAGFPLHVYQSPAEPKCEHDGLVYGHTIAFLTDGAFFVPTLEELMQACAGKFQRLTRYSHRAQTEGEWEATAYMGLMRGNGLTPDVAVARLYLALHANGDASA